MTDIKTHLITLEMTAKLRGWAISESPFMFCNEGNRIRKEMISEDFSAKANKDLEEHELICRSCCLAQLSTYLHLKKKGEY